MDEKQAKEAFPRMLWSYHKKEKVFVNNGFDIHHLRVNPGSILDIICKRI